MDSYNDNIIKKRQLPTNTFKKSLISDLNYLNYPLYVVSTIGKTTTAGSTTIGIIKDIHKSNGLISFYRAPLTLLVLSPIYLSAKYLVKGITNKVISIISNRYVHEKCENESENKIMAKNILNYLTSLIYQYPKMIIQQCIILSPLSYSCFNTFRHVILRDNGDLSFKQTFILILKLIPSLPMLLARRLFQIFFTNQHRLKSSILSGFAFKNLFYGAIAVVPLIISKKLIELVLDKVNEKVLNSTNVNNKFKQIYCNDITQSILYTILTNPLDVIQIQYVNEFVNSFVSAHSANKLVKTTKIRKNKSKLLDTSIVPDIIDPISMAIKLYQKQQGGGLSIFFSGIIPLTLFNISNKLFNNSSYYYIIN